MIIQFPDYEFGLVATTGYFPVERALALSYTTPE